MKGFGVEKFRIGERVENIDAKYVENIDKTHEASNRQGARKKESGFSKSILR